MSWGFDLMGCWLGIHWEFTALGCLGMEGLRGPRAGPRLRRGLCPAPSRHPGTSGASLHPRPRRDPLGRGHPLSSDSKDRGG